MAEFLDNFGRTLQDLPAQIGIKAQRIKDSLLDRIESLTQWVPDNMPPPEIDPNKLQYTDTVDLSEVEPGTMVGLLPYIREVDEAGDVSIRMVAHPDSIFTILVGIKGGKRTLYVWRTQINLLRDSETRKDIQGMALRVSLDDFVSTSVMSLSPKDNSTPTRLRTGRNLVMPYFLEGKGRKGKIKSPYRDPQGWTDRQVSKIGTIVIHSPE